MDLEKEEIKQQLEPINDGIQIRGNDSEEVSFEVKLNILILNGSQVLTDQTVKITHSKLASYDLFKIKDLQFCNTIYQFDISNWEFNMQTQETEKSRQSRVINLCNTHKQKSSITYTILDYNTYEKHIPYLTQSCWQTFPTYKESFEFIKYIKSTSNLHMSIVLSNQNTSKLYVAKQHIISQSNGIDGAKLAENEIKNLKKVRGDNNFIQLHQVFKDKDAITLLIDFAEFGNLRDYIQHYKYLENKELKIIMGQLLTAIDKLRPVNIIHRNIKPENILILNKENFEISLIGLARSCNYADQESFKIPIQASLYDDPSVQTGNDWDYSSDIFSAGCLFYFLVTGIDLKSDFVSRRQLESGINLYQAQVDLTCKHVSAQCQDLLKRMLEYDQLLRPTATQCLQHPWFNQLLEQNDEPLKIPLNINESSSSLQKDLVSKLDNDFSSFVFSPNYFQNLDSYNKDNFAHKNNDQQSRPGGRQFRSNNQDKNMSSKQQESFSSNNNDALRMYNISIFQQAKAGVVRSNLEEIKEHKESMQEANEEIVPFAHVITSDSQFSMSYQLEELQGENEDVEAKIIKRLHINDFQLEERSLSQKNSRIQSHLFNDE